MFRSWIYRRYKLAPPTAPTRTKPLGNLWCFLRPPDREIDCPLDCRQPIAPPLRMPDTDGYPALACEQMGFSAYDPVAAVGGCIVPMGPGDRPFEREGNTPAAISILSMVQPMVAPVSRSKGRLRDRHPHFGERRSASACPCYVGCIDKRCSDEISFAERAPLWSPSAHLPHL